MPDPGRCDSLRGYRERVGPAMLQGVIAQIVLRVILQLFQLGNMLAQLPEGR
jgi:hypothetical protein